MAISAPNLLQLRASPLTLQQLRQLGDIHSNPPRPHGWKQSIGIAMLSGGRIGGSHEGFAIHLGNLRRDHRRWKPRRSPRLSVVRLLQFSARRCHELRVRNISTMLSHRERHWRVVRGQSHVPVLAGTAPTSTGLCLLKARASATAPAGVATLAAIRRASHANAQVGCVERPRPALHSGSALCSRKRDGICGNAFQSSARR
jgi:hypothetical protein